MDVDVAEQFIKANTPIDIKVEGRIEIRKAKKCPNGNNCDISVFSHYIFYINTIKILLIYFVIFVVKPSYSRKICNENIKGGIPKGEYC